eukprot:scaffold1390_cov138-Cylindrotheca_fusiformis.AAC.44
MAADPSHQRRLTLQALAIEVPTKNSDDEEDDDVDEEDLQYRSHLSISSDSQQYNSDHEEGTTKSAQERLAAELLEYGITPDIQVDDKDEVDSKMSDLTIGEKSYVMDLGRQKVMREETMKQEAILEAHEWYKKA